MRDMHFITRNKNSISQFREVQYACLAFFTYKKINMSTLAKELTWVRYQSRVLMFSGWYDVNKRMSFWTVEQTVKIFNKKAPDWWQQVNINSLWFTVSVSGIPWILSSASFLTYCFNALFFWKLNLKVGWRAFVNQICIFFPRLVIEGCSKVAARNVCQLCSRAPSSEGVHWCSLSDRWTTWRLMWEDASRFGHDFQGWRLQTQTKLCSGLITPHQQQLDLKVFCKCRRRWTQHLSTRTKWDTNKENTCSCSATGLHLTLGCCLWLQRAFTWLQNRLDC